MFLNCSCHVKILPVVHSLGKRSKESEKVKESQLQSDCLEPSYVITVSH